MIQKNLILKESIKHQFKIDDVQNDSYSKFSTAITGNKEDKIEYN